MPDIRPVSELRNHFKEIEAAIHKTNQPIFLTNNGRASMVLLSNEAYDQLIAKANGQPARPEYAPDEDVNFGNVLGKLILANDMTTEMLSKATGISIEDLNDLLDNQRLPTDDEIENLATALHVSRIAMSSFLEPASGKLEHGIQKTLLKILGTIAEG